MKCFRLPFLFLLLYSLPLTILAQNYPLHYISEKELESHVAVLASDSLYGRGLSTKQPGLHLAASYLISQIEKIGLSPTDNHYYQNFTLYTSSPYPENSFIKLTNGKGQEIKKLTNFTSTNQDFEVLDFRGELVFAGYGISNDETGYNNFKGIEIKDKVVIYSAGAPQSVSQGLSHHWDTNLEREKMNRIFNAGAKGIILVTSIYDSDNQTYSRLKRSADRIRYSLDPFTKIENLNVVFLTPDAADILLGKKNGWKKLISSVSQKKTSAELKNRKVHIYSERHINEITSGNVIGYIEGTDPMLQNECVLFMAHYDHLGIDGDGEIFNGADDNASGAAVLLELARTFSGITEKPRRSMVFLWPSAEEAGLLGSEYYSRNPFFPFDKTVACINLDMVGRVFETRDSVWNNSPKLVKDFNGIYSLINHFNPLLKEYTDYACHQLDLVPDYSLPDRFFFTSDHYHFHRNKVPVLNLSTGYSADYHKTTDEAWRLRPDKMKKVAELCIIVGLKLANAD
jgi:hypothetical protein